MPSDASEHELIPELTTASIVNRKSLESKEAAAERKTRRLTRVDNFFCRPNHREERVSSKSKEMGELPDACRPITKQDACRQKICIQKILHTWELLVACRGHLADAC